MQVFKDRDLKEKLLKAIDMAKNKAIEGAENWFIARAPNLHKLTMQGLHWIISAEEQDMRNI